MVPVFSPGKRRLFLIIASIGLLIIIVNLLMLSGVDVKARIKDITILQRPNPKVQQLRAYYLWRPQ